MKFKCIHIYTLFSLAFVGSHAVSPEVYWKSVLPNTHMPKAIKDLLYTKEWDDGKEKVSTCTVSTIASKYEVKDQPQPSYSEWYYGNISQLKDHPFIRLLFLGNDLHQGEEMKLHFMENGQKTSFLPENISNSIPFSSKDLPDIYNKFSVKPDSTEAKIMKQTLSICDQKAIEGEEKFCATSLESMVDFTISKLGRKVKALSTKVNSKESTPPQKYMIKLVKKLTANKDVVCHRLNYPYAIFYCHINVGTQSYVVSLEGANGTKVKSVAVCHTDTSKWNPKHVAFQLLKVTLGTVPVCHFLPKDHVIWVPY